MINRVLDLQNFTVGQITTPARQNVTVEIAPRWAKR
jgi:CBS domain containing-hemolysin-like protein